MSAALGSPTPSPMAYLGRGKGSGVLSFRGINEGSGEAGLFLG